MKKLTKKLILKTESIRILTGAELSHVAGGSLYYVPPGSAGAYPLTISLQSLPSNNKLCHGF